MKILFLHGKESRPGGKKAAFLERAGHTVLNPLLPKNDWNESVKIARKIYKEEKPDIVVGSSRGGAVAMSLGEQISKMILIAPAWRNFCKEELSIPKNTVILHSDQDDIVSYEDSVMVALKYDVRLIRVGNDHRMSDDAALKQLSYEVDNKFSTI